MKTDIIEAWKALRCFLAATPIIVTQPTTCIPAFWKLCVHSPFQLRILINRDFRCRAITWLQQPSALSETTKSLFWRLGA